jgi:hypothetical protein
MNDQCTSRDHDEETTYGKDECFTHDGLGHTTGLGLGPLFPHILQVLVQYRRIDWLRGS